MLACSVASYEARGAIVDDSDSEVGIRYKRSTILAILRDLETIVVSLDRLGSTYESDRAPEYARRMVEFIHDWEVFHRLARARTLLSAPFDALDPDELEQEMEGVPHWSFSAGSALDS